VATEFLPRLKHHRGGCGGAAAPVLRLLQSPEGREFSGLAPDQRVVIDDIEPDGSNRNMCCRMRRPQPVQRIPDLDLLRNFSAVRAISNQRWG
jgi:hypothetical protein